MNEQAGLTDRAKAALGGGLGAPIIAGIIMLALWEGALAVFQPEGFVLPPPSEIIGSFGENFSEIWAATRVTGWNVLSGLIAGVVAAVGAALLVTRFRIAREAIVPLAVAINAVPIIALAPMLNNWYELTSSRSNQIIVALLVFFPIFINTVKGLTLVDPSQIELMESFAAGQWTITREVRIPNAMPLFFTALKLASSLAVIGAIVAEYFGGRQDALGPMITQAAGLTRYAEAWAAVAAGAFIGAVLYLLSVVLERVAMPWHSTIRSTSGT